MKMKEYNLIACQCEETGEMGLRVEGTSLSNFYDGDIMVMFDAVGIAHDIVEHVNGLEKIGTVFDEFQALGAIWRTRGQFGDLRRDNVGSAWSVEQNIASDITRMARYAHWEDMGGRIEVEPEETGHEEYLQQIIDHAAEDIPGELEESFDEFDMEDYLEQAMWGMQTGIHKHRQLYERSIWANTLFWNIVEALTPYMRGIEEWHTFRLTVHEDTLNVYCHQYYYDDELGEEVEL